MTENSKKLRAMEIEARLIQFSVRVIKLAGSLPKEVAANHLASQIARSATSPALNYGEAQNAESTDDFRHKIKICLKELRETYVCLKIIDELGWFHKNKLSTLLAENNELLSIFVATTKTLAANKTIKRG